MPRTPKLSVILRIQDSIGLAEWCASIDPAIGRPDLFPTKPWTELTEGDSVTADDGAVYEVLRLVPIEAAPTEAPSEDLFPECRELILAMGGRSYDEYATARPR